MIALIRTLSRKWSIRISATVSNASIPFPPRTVRCSMRVQNPQGADRSNRDRRGLRAGRRGQKSMPIHIAATCSRCRKVLLCGERGAVRHGVELALQQNIRPMQEGSPQRRVLPLVFPALVHVARPLEPRRPHAPASPTSEAACEPVLALLKRQKNFVLQKRFVMCKH